MYSPKDGINNYSVFPVTGGKIDYAAHDNDAATMLGEMEDFDEAVAEAYKFYLQHRDETLIIITADHETGGVSLGIADNGYESDFGILAKQKMSMTKFASIIKKQTKKLEHNGAFQIKDCVGKTVDVYLRIPANKGGKGIKCAGMQILMSRIIGQRVR